MGEVEVEVEGEARTGCSELISICWVAWGWVVSWAGILMGVGVVVVGSEWKLFES